MNKKTTIIFLTLLILFLIIKYISNFYIDYEWFKINNGVNIFWTLFFTKFNVQMIFGASFIGIFMLNFFLLGLLGGKGRFFVENFLDRIKIPAIGSSRRLLLLILTGVIIFIGFVMGGTASAFWKEYLMYKNSVAFTGFPADPIFNKDIGFYVFSLPFYQFLYNWFMSTIMIITIFSIIIHFFNGGIFFRNGKLDFSLFCRVHISILLAVLVILYGLGYQLSAYEILYLQLGKFYGAGYTAVNSKLIAYRAAEIISFIAGALLLFNVFKKSFKLPVIVMLTLIPVYFILGTVYPQLQQRFIVIPNELDKEQPFIQNNIDFTRIAYGINHVEEIPFENSKNLTYRDILTNKDTMESVRLWDWRPLKQTYKQLQELKQYYFFNDVDIDRYIIDNKKIAVNISARELSIDGLGKNTQTWQNKHLIYTHGYGAAMSRVDRISSEGLPVFLIKDIPPKTEIDIKIDRPEIYYGEHKNSYVITNTSIKPGEFDYPSGDENKYSTYSGTGGIKLDSLFKRIMVSAAFGDMNLLISGNINRESRVLFRRNITEIVNSFVPFLEIDDDPYLVIDEGKLYWIIDAYTQTDQFPYSTPIYVKGKDLNYIRNSVKIIIDAYNGKIGCYISDENDPIIKAYAKIFPDIFKDLKEIPEGLKAHIRYPETIFNIQSQILLKYHMTNPNVFYNNEDMWSIPLQISGDKEGPVQSYYLVTTLPNEKMSEFILILPFTPYKKHNMLAFLIAKCDLPDYGKLQLYILPKDKLNYGPMQIEARINQDPEISKQLTLWSQKGTGVIRGNMLAIPVNESIIYIEPLYLKAEASEMPELKKVIVSFADMIIMENDLPTALERLFLSSNFMSQHSKENTQGMNLKALADRASYHFSKAEEFMRAGNWKNYGEELENLKNILNQMKNQEN
ncbi:MAG: UPF0182 family protein [Leptospirales bacterium]|nr:UPF0182 family protein [Leptospirales bacterium]